VCVQEGYVGMLQAGVVVGPKEKVKRDPVRTNGKTSSWGLMTTFRVICQCNQTIYERIYSALNLGATYFSETSVIAYKTTRCRNADDHSNHRREVLKTFLRLGHVRVSHMQAVRSLTQHVTLL
jgi:hypothetical protein